MDSDSLKFAIVPEDLLLSGISHIALRVWCILQRHANADAEAFPSHKVLAEKCQCSMKTIREAIKALEKERYLTVHHRYRDDGSMTSNLYTLHYDRQMCVPPVSNYQGVPAETTSPPPAETTYHEREPVLTRAIERESIGEAGTSPPPPKTPPKAKPPDSLETHVSECVGLLNELTGRRYQPTSSACKHLRARLRAVPIAERPAAAAQARLILQFKVSQWLADPKMRSYLRPETLWGAEHWDTYGQEALDWDEAGRPPPVHTNGKATAVNSRKAMIEEALRNL